MPKKVHPDVKVLADKIADEKTKLKDRLLKLKNRGDALKAEMVAASKSKDKLAFTKAKFHLDNMYNEKNIIQAKYSKLSGIEDKLNGILSKQYEPGALKKVAKGAVNVGRKVVGKIKSNKIKAGLAAGGLLLYANKKRKQAKQQEPPRNEDQYSEDEY